MKHTLERFIGKRFGKLTVLSFAGRTVKGQSIWLCKCDCGKEIKPRGDRLLNTVTRSCGCSQRGAGNTQWKGCGEIAGYMYGGYKKNANKRGLNFTITIKYMWKLFLSQNRKCALTGEELHFSPDAVHRYNGTASLDRINNEKGYIKGNVQWVHKDINRMKWDLDQTKFLELCNKVSQYTTPV